MKLLAIDTTSIVCSCALLSDGIIVGEKTTKGELSHTEQLLPQILELLKETNTTFDELDAFACTTGPGSFTGVRIGVAAIKGIAFARNKPCIEVSTLEALATNLLGYNGTICSVMDARRNQVYTALFQIEDGALIRKTPDQAITCDELYLQVLDASQDKPIHFVGDGYDLIANDQRFSSLSSFDKTPDELRLQKASSVAIVAYKKYLDGDIKTDQQISPVYLRLSQAERERLEKEKLKENSL